MKGARRLEQGAVAAVLWIAAATLFWRADLGHVRDRLVLLVGALTAVAILSQAVLEGARAGRLSLLQVMLLVSFLAHAGAAVLLGTWRMAREIAEPRAPFEAALDAHALAEEKLAARIREEVAPLEAEPPAPAPPEGRAEPLLPAQNQEAAAVRLAPSVPAPPLAGARPLPPAAAVPLRLEERPASPLPDPAASPLERLAAPEPALLESRPLVLGTAGPPGAPVTIPFDAAPAPAPGAPPLPPRPAERIVLEERESVFALRSRKKREAVLEALGGDAKTEEAVVRALEWFARNQEPDGRWRLERFGGEEGHDTAATGLALLCFYGWGARHDEEGEYRDAVRKGLGWLRARAAPDGDLTGGRDNGMYDQGIGTLALAEACGVTGDAELAEPLRLSVAFILRAQKAHGGWRYRPDSRDGDTSVTGWQVMALRSAELAGTRVPESAWTGAARWLGRVGGGKEGGLYGYVNDVPHPAMVAQGMICRQLLGARKEEARSAESAAYLSRALPDGRRPNFYYWYCGSLALYHHPGTAWEEWNRRMKPILLSAQSASGTHAGSWPAAGDWAKAAGRLGTTAFATLTLEVYYRYLPLYRPAALK